MNRGREEAPSETQHEAEYRRADRQAHEAAVEHVLVPPALVDVAGVPLHRLRLLHFAHVVVDVPELHLPEALELRAVRVALLIREGVVLPVNGDPLPRGKTRREPEAELEDPLEARVHRERAMRRSSMKKYGGAEHRHLRDES